jgi:hypothetical protein
MASPICFDSDWLYSRNGAPFLQHPLEGLAAGRFDDTLLEQITS